MDGLLVGRDAECAALGRLLAARPAGPVPVVLVTGEAGAGKTTLVEHVLATLPAPVLRGRAPAWACPAYEVVASALRPVIRDTAQPLPAVLAPIMPELGHLPADSNPATLAAAVCSVLTAAAGDRALTLFLDDLQWADEASLDLLAALADAARGLPVVLVGCYRSDELPRGHRLRAVRALLRRNQRLTEITLGPLGDDDVTRMLTGLWGVTPQPELATVVASRADGLPFAVEELAFALRDAGRLDYRDGAVALAGAGAAPVPEGIREAVLLRASRLTAGERALLEAAAVAGIEFDIDIVLAAGGTAAWPDGFTASGLLTEARDGRAAFRHPLTQEAAYADIPWSRRRGLHRALASTLAGHQAAPALIAAHLLAARDFGPARRSLLAAAEEHYAVHAYRDAARALRTALEHWPPDEQDDSRLTAVDRLARCAEMCSDYADAVMLLRELADGHEQQRLADALEHSGDYRAATAAYAAAYQYCDAHGADAVGQLCRACASFVLFARGEWDRTAGVCEDVLASAAAPHARAVGDGLLGLVHAMRGAATLGRPHLLESNLTATRIELTAMELLSSWGLCVLDDAAGAVAGAADRARQILARLARTQERHYSVPILQWAATFFTERGMAADASACASALMRIAEATAQPEAIAALAHARGETLLADQPEAAAHELSSAAEMFSRLDLPLQTAQAQRRAAAATARLGEPARARELLHAAHATADQLGARHLRDSCTTALRQLGDTPRRPVNARRVTAGLTSRELDVMELVSQGNTSRQVGHTLFISPRTVEMHVNSSMQKLQCRTRAEAVRRLTELEALPRPDAVRQEPG